MSDLEFSDTPALEVLARLPRSDIDPTDIVVAQDLLRLAKTLLRSFAEQFAMHGLSPGRYALMMTLQARAAPLAPSEIADRLGVTRATVTGLVSGMVRDGLIVFAPAEGADRRRKAVALTDRGRELAAVVAPEVFQQMASLLTPLSAPERNTLRGLLRRIEDGLSG